jgi:anti-sigma-K factor RskA
MIDERQEEFASLYALELLEGEERTQFEAALQRDAALQTLVRELRETSAAVAYSAPVAAAPAGLKTQLLAEIATRPAASPPRETAKVIAFPALTWIALAAAACFALVAGWLTRLYVGARAEADLLRDQSTFADIALKTARQQLEAERILARGQVAQLDQQIAELRAQADVANLKIALLASLAKDSREAYAVAVWNPAKQEGVFTLEKMPAPAPDQRLELWVVEARAGAKPVSAGVLDVGANGTVRAQFKPSAAVSTLAAFAVSREKNDGVRFHATPNEVIMQGLTR